LREGFFSRRSNLNALAISDSCDQCEIDLGACYLKTIHLLSCYPNKKNRINAEPDPDPIFPLVL